MSARSVLQRLSLKDEHTFRFSDFLITDLCNSSANCWLSELIVVPLCVVEDLIEPTK